MGHGNHWEAIGADIDATVLEILPKVVQKGKLAGEKQFDQPLEHGGTRRETAYAIIYPDTPLSYLTLVTTDSTGPEVANNVVSGYPYCSAGVTNRILVDEVKPWEGPIEGIICGTTVGGASVAFFDPDFYKNRHIYKVGKAYDFAVAGLAYRLQKTTQDTITINEGPAVELERERLLEINPDADVSLVTSVELSLAEMRYLMPCEKVEEDSEFRTIAEEVGYFEAEDIGFYRIRATLTIPNDKPFDGYIYASETVLNGYRPQKGDSIEGFVWLQARLVSEQEYEPEPGMKSCEGKMLAITGLSQTTPSADEFAGLHPGLNALGRTLLTAGADVAQYNNPDNAPDIPVFFASFRGQEIDIWARAAVTGQEPDPAFTPEETARFTEKSKTKGHAAAMITVRCKDIGKGYMLKFTGLDSLAPEGDICKLDYISKESLDERFE